MALDPTYLRAANGIYVTRGAEVPLASFSNGCNVPGTNSPGIGINMEGGAIIGTPEQFTLLNQEGTTRVPQKGCVIGAVGYSDPDDWPSSGGEQRYGILPNNIQSADGALQQGNGLVTPNGTANLQTLAAGWVPTAV